jgi:ABC-type polysaccharide/polyol phosphate transport system ATPase subunit
MRDQILSCTGIHKIFDAPIVPSSLLQDYVLRRRMHRPRKRIFALNDISLALGRGEWIGLYGPNGSGKTTLLQILAGLLPAEKGTVVAHGDVTGIFELGTGFHPEWNAEENIRFHGLLHGCHPADVEKSREAIIAFAGIASHRKLPLKCYSQGMKARLAFAALAHIDADVYLLDEVFAVGDAAFRQQCWECIRRMRKEGKSGILVSHGIQDLERQCDRILFLEQGRLIQEQPVVALVA